MKPCSTAISWHTDVEFVVYQRIAEVPRKVGIAAKRAGTAAPAFVAHLVYLGGADREGRVFVKEEIATVVVINDDGDVRFDLVQPFLDGFVGVEQGFPVGLVMASLIRTTPIDGT